MSVTALMTLATLVATPFVVRRTLAGLDHAAAHGLLVLQAGPDVLRFVPPLNIAAADLERMLDIFAHDRSLVSDDLARMRYEASVRPGFHESYAEMFPAPRQRWVDAMASAEADIRALPHETLVIHGREDRVIPLSNSLTLAQWIPNAQLHVFGHCGHWTQIEHNARFNRLVGDFLAEADSA